MSKRAWTRASNWCTVIGFVIWAPTILLSLANSDWYQFNRPHGPDPERGWTVQFGSARGAFGSPEEVYQEQLLHLECLAGFTLGALGLGIRIHKLGMQQDNPIWLKLPD